MPYIKDLASAIKDILDSIKSILESATEEGELLEGVKEVVRGDRVRPRPEPPTIWIFTDEAVAIHPPMSLAEKWSLPIVLSAVYKTDDPDTGYMEATSLAAKARSVILKDRTLGLRNFIQDVQSVRFDPSGPHFNEGQLYGAAATVNVIFTIFEK